MKKRRASVNRDLAFLFSGLALIVLSLAVSAMWRGMPWWLWPSFWAGMALSGIGGFAIQRRIWRAVMGERDDG